MYSTIVTGALQGVSAYPVTVEVDISSGLPGLSLVGSLSQEVREAKERVGVALRNAGFHLPASRITVNLSPANRRKEGTSFDLSIAVGLLAAMNRIPSEKMENTLFLGELGLDGEIKGVPGVLPIVREAVSWGVRQCVVPVENALEGALISGITVRGASSLQELFSFLTADDAEAEALLPAIQLDAMKLFQEKAAERMPDFAEVNGQETAKRGAEIAAAGFHNLLMAGPPGAGKSMIAKRIPGILPPLTLEESLEVTSVFSVAGLLKEGEAMVTERPFRNPHHSISLAALVGGSTVPRPGMISLAHRGVLFLDELPEFQRMALDSLRQPLEEHEVHIARVNGTVTYPSDFMLVCAMNPCPCGFYPDINRCRCTENQVRRYMGKVSGPILDRIDLCVELQAVDIASLKNRKKNESSKMIRERVIRAREIQKERFRDTKYRFNGDIEAADMENYCALGRKEQQYMEQLYRSLNLSARAYHRILKVARTIADLAGAKEIAVEHLLEASFYRPAQEYWR
ncbi:MAG: YifB family Mg chelatase-like AAA ATPase [Blautia sp.]|nr:YifB family Mg chelatase-like AAA ATPase [Blautia sp.]